MLNAGFVATLALGFLALLTWGARTLPAERWQMLAAIPVAKSADGSWQGLNLTFYGFFSATGTAFGFAILLLLLASVGLPIAVTIAVVLFILFVCVPASRLIAAIVEGKRNTFTVAGAAFVATIVLPLLFVAAQPVAARLLHHEVPLLPVFSAAAIGYVLGESIGRLACLSFGCCYGMPLRDARPILTRLFRKYHLVVQGATKKAAYASGLAGEPLIPVQAITSVVFAVAGLAGVALFLAQQYRLAAVIPVTASWGWRAASECLRADHRGSTKISIYQVMAVISIIYLTVFVSLIPSSSVIPDLGAGFVQLTTAPVILALQLFWIGLFVYYGRSRVTASTLSFRVISDKV